MKPTNLAAPAAARLLAAALLAASASPALAVTPFKMRVPIGPIVAAAPVPGISIPGYNPLTGTFQAPNGSFTWDGTAYTIPSGTAFGITGPVALTPAVTADSIKTAILGNPLSIPGTLADSWAGTQGIGWDGTAWGWTVSRYLWKSGNTCSTASWGTGTEACRRYGADVEGQDPDLYWAAATGGGCYRLSSPRSITGTPAVLGCGAPPPDASALPDPTPAVGSELPYAPYMPAGVAIQNNFTITDLNTGTVHHCTNGGCD